LTNERSEFLTAALPVADLHAAISHETAVVPYFAEGHGWTTQILLVNLTDSALIGHVELRNQAGELMPVMRYSIPPRGSQKLGISGGTAPVLAGSALLVPESGTPTPGGLVLLSFQDRGKGITVAEAGIPAVPTGSAFRLHVEAKGDFDHGAANSIQTGLAIANKSTSPATLSLDLRRLDGSSTNLLGSLIIPVNGQVTTLLKQIPGFDALPPDFEGILRVSGPESLSVVGVRGRYNERKDFLISVTPPVNEAARPSTAPLYFPLIVDSENFTTQFVLFPSQPGLVSSGEIRFFAQNGESLYLRLK
jgi:hypothetical protein